MLDDSADELFVDLAADQAQHLAPVVVAAVGVEQGDQVLFVQRLGDIELVDDVGRTEILQERAVHEGVAVRAQIAEDEVAGPQLFDQCPGNRPGLVETQLGVQVVFDQAGQRRTVDVVRAGFVGQARLHGVGHAAQDVGLLPQTNLVAQAREFAQRPLDVPLVQEQPRALLVQVDTVVGQLLVPIQDGHHRQQERVARKLGDRLRFLDRAGQPLTLGLAFLRFVERDVVPLVQEAADLVFVEILQHEVAEIGAVQPKGLVANHARREHNADVLVLVAEAVDIVDHPLALDGIEHLVQAVQQEHDPARLLQQVF